MHCPKCQSENTQTLEMAYRSGTQNLSGSIHASGIGFGRDGAAIAAGSGVLAGTTQSLLARDVAPPERRGYLFKAFFGFMASLGVMSGWGAFYWLSLAVLLVCFYRAYRCFAWNRTVWPDLMSAWRSTSICHRCGERFTGASA